MTVHSAYNYTNSVTWGKYYWPYFLTLASGLFGIPELIALFTNHWNTLSDYARYELNLSLEATPHTVVWWASLAAWLLFVAVITPHIWGNWG